MKNRVVALLIGVSPLMLYLFLAGCISTPGTTGTTAVPSMRQILGQSGTKNAKKLPALRAPEEPSWWGDLVFFLQVPVIPG